jgi:hypothetical protein
MGCWNDTCFVTNLPVFAGDPVEVLFLRADPVSDSFCYPNDSWTPYSFTFHGKYDDYGGVEDCEGVALPYLVEAIQENLVEMDANTREYSPGNISVLNEAVEKEGLTIGKILDYESEGRLKVYKWEDAKSKLGKRLAQDKETCMVKHVVIHKKVYDMMVGEFEWEMSSRIKIGKPAYDEDYAPHRVSIQDILNLYLFWLNEPDSEKAEYVREIVIQYPGMNGPYFPRLNRIYENVANDSIEKLRALREGYFGEVLKEGGFELYKNAVKLVVFNVFMMRGRRSYAIPSGAGSQDDSTNAQNMVADMIKYQIERREEQIKEWDEE